MTGYRIHGNELQFCTNQSPVQDMYVLSQGKFLVNNIEKKCRKVKQGFFD